MADQNWFQRFMSTVFDQRGGVYVGLATLAVTFMAVAEFIKGGWKAPAWYVTIPLGVYAFILGLFVVRKGSEYFIDSKYNSPPDKPPEKKDGQSGFARLSLLMVVVVALIAVSAFAETPKEMKTRLQRISKECAERTGQAFDFSEEARIASDCLRIGSLRDDLTRCAKERNHLRRAGGCAHTWERVGQTVKGCVRCGSIAHVVNGEWLLVLTEGAWVGPDPMEYPNEYNLR